MEDTFEDKRWFRVKVYCHQSKTYTYFDEFASTPEEAMEFAEEDSDVQAISVTISEYQ